MKKRDKITIEVEEDKPIRLKLVAGGAHHIDKKFFDAYSKIPYITRVAS